MNKLVELTQYLVQRYALILNYVHKMTEIFKNLRKGKGGEVLNDVVQTTPPFGHPS